MWYNDRCCGFMLCLQWCWGDAIMRLWFDELRVRKEELAKIQHATNYCDLLSIAHTCFMNANYGSAFQNEIGHYSKVTEYYAEVNDVTKFDYFKYHLEQIIKGNKFLQLIMHYIK